MNGEDQDPWKINPDQNQPRRYVLNSQDRLYCANEKCGSYREATLVRRIREDRIKDFPERIQDLVDDIMLVEYADANFLDSHERNELWSKIIDIEQRSTEITDDETLTPIDRSDEAQFGFELGNSLRILRSDESKIEPLVWGVLQGLLSGSAEDARVQTMIIERILSQFEKRVEERRHRAKSKTSIDNSLSDFADEIRHKINMYLNSKDIGATAKDIKITDDLISDARRGNKYQDFDEKIESYIDDRKLADIDDLRWQLEEDSRIVEHKNKQGVQVRKIFEHMYLASEDGEHSKEDFPLRPSVRHMLVAALKQLSNRTDGGLNMNRPAVEQVSEGWKLTTYGNLLSYTVFEEEDSTWVYTYAVEPYDLQEQQRRKIESLVLM